MKDLKKDLKKMFKENFDGKLTKEELKSVLEENFSLTGIVLYKDTRKIHSVAYDGQGFESKKANMINYDLTGDTVEEYLGVNRVVLATICKAINDEDGKEMNSEYPEDLQMDLETEGYVLTLTTQDADGTEETVKYLLPACSVESIKIID